MEKMRPMLPMMAKTREQLKMTPIFQEAVLGQVDEDGGEHHHGRERTDAAATLRQSQS